MITFDPTKRDVTFRDRGLDFRTAESVFTGPSFSFLDQRRDYGEDRIVTVGRFDSRMVMIVWTPRGEDRHVLSMRKANDREQARYAHLLR